MLLCSQASLRASFSADPAGTLAAFGCDSTVESVLKEIPESAVERYATGLLAKRWTEVARVLRWTSMVWPGVKEHYQDWLADSPAPASSTSLAPGVVEALRALPTLQKQLARDDLAPPYVRDLLGFEIFGRASSQDGVLRDWEASYRVHELVAELKVGRIPFDVEPMPTRYQFAEGMSWRAP